MENSLKEKLNSNQQDEEKKEKSEDQKQLQFMKEEVERMDLMI